MSHSTIAIIGAGNMARALTRGLLAAQWPTDRLRASHPKEEVRNAWVKEFGIPMHADNAATAKGADVVIVAVKPHKIPEMLHELHEEDPSRLTISIAAGVPIHVLAKFLGEGARIIRAMPNQPALLGAGATGLARGETATEDDVLLARRIFEAVGLVEVLEDEELIDVVTALAGSGPAFVYRIAQALAEGAQACGLPHEQAQNLAMHTVYGAGAVLHSEKEDLATLIKNVASPGGTTEAGLNALEDRHINNVITAAIKAATRRAKDLAAAAQEAAERQPE